MQRSRNPFMPMTRLEMFMDGVFAIAITLLIIEIKVPDHSELEEAGGLSNYLIHIWPQYLSYIISFFILGVWWSSMHHFHLMIKRTNHTFNLINIFFLMTIAFIPFTTAVLGDYISETEHRQTAVTLYCLGYYLPSLAAVMMVMYAFPNHRLVDANITKRYLNKFRNKILAGQILVLTAFITSLFFPIAAIIITGITFMLFFIPPESIEYENSAN
jgi:uncharacterized membrane protein